MLPPCQCGNVMQTLYTPQQTRQEPANAYTWQYSALPTHLLTHPPTHLHAVKYLKLSSIHN